MKAALVELAKGTLVLALATYGTIAWAKRSMIGPCEPYRDGGCRTCSDCSKCQHCHIERGQCSVCMNKRVAKVFLMCSLEHMETESAPRRWTIEKRAGRWTLADGTAPDAKKRTILWQSHPEPAAMSLLLMLLHCLSESHGSAGTIRILWHPLPEVELHYGARPHDPVTSMSLPPPRA